jgi:hypothetical protein
VASGAWRAWPGAWPGGVRRRDALPPGFLDFAAAWWPPLDAAEVLSWLREPEFLARVGDGVISAEDQRLLGKSWGNSTDLSVEDVPLLDELRYALGDVRRAPDEVELDSTGPAQLGRRAMQELTTASEREYARLRRAGAADHRIEDDAYAHVLVDEAQDLTPMQWRMVGRRGRTATWTIVGDPAQSSWPVPSESASARAERCGQGDPRLPPLDELPQLRRDLRLRRGVRRRVGLDADLPEAVRSTGVVPEERVVTDLEQGVRDALASVSDVVDGTVGIVAPVARQAEVRAWLGSWPEHEQDRAGGADARIAVLTGLDTKGLEFDAIVVVEPAEIEAESPTGGRRSTSCSPGRLSGW